MPPCAEVKLRTTQRATCKQDRPDVPNMRAHSGPARWGPMAIAAEPIAAEPIATERFPARREENSPSLRAESLAQVAYARAVADR